MSDASPILGLPYILPSQAQKHVTHNEAIRLLDVLVQLAVADRGRTAAPTDPAEGDRHIVGSGATGAWAGRDGQIALWEATGWAFLAPLPGWRAAVLEEARTVVWDGAGWVSAADLPQSFPRLGIAAAADDTNRLAVGSPASLFSHAGSGGHQLKLNKALPADTASLLFQTGFAGRAEMGTAGSDAFTVKVSADGTAWLDALAADPASGRMRLPGGLALPDGSAAAPALAFADDPDTGLRRPAADQIGLVAGAVQRAALSGAAFQIDVPVTGTAVTASATDATAGRLLRVGDAGLLGVPPAAPADIGVTDNTIPRGVWMYGSQATITAGLPSRIAASNETYLFHHRRVSSYEVQMLLVEFAAADADRTLWFRRRTGGAWGNWKRMYDWGNVLGTVSQSSGVPTGALIERGSNANGEYVRYADGTQICTFVAEVASLAIGTAFLGGFRAFGQLWTFPAAFLAATVPSVAGSAQDSTGFSVAFATTGNLNTTWLITAITSQSAATRKASLLAVGRWY